MIFWNSSSIPTSTIIDLAIFPETITDDKGKQRKRYPYKNLIMTPYEKLKSLAHAEHYLKPELTWGHTKLHRE